MIGRLFPGRRERTRRQAADWIAKLNGPHGERDRAAFAQWYHADAAHAAAFDRLSALFATAGQIRPAPDAGVSGPRAVRGAHRWPRRYALAAAAAGLMAVVLGFTLLGGRAELPSREELQSAVYAATGGQERLLNLADGSQVLLEPGSALAVTIGRAERRLELERGEGRFTVSRDARPFIVGAAGAEIVAHGTQFVVRLGSGGTLVSLIEGRVDVTYPQPGLRAERRQVSLAPGERVVVPVQPTPPGATGISTGADPHAPMVEFDDVRLAQAVERVNRLSRRSAVSLAEAPLGDLRITGAFRAGDAEGFANGAATALGLEVERAADSRLTLRAGPGRTR